MREIEDFTSPLDDVDEETDFRFELPPAESGLVVIVDDDPAASTLHRSLLEAAGYVVEVFHRPSEALERIEPGTPIVVLTDFAMPEMSGLELAERAIERDPEVNVILLTGQGDESTAQAALRMGLSDYIKKPPEPVALARSVQRAFHQRAAERHHRAMVQWMRLELDRRAAAVREVTLGTLTAMVNALDLRSPHFHGHSRAVAIQAAAIAESLGLGPDEVEEVRTAGLLHDVGMMAVPDRLVEKEGALTEDEFEVIRSHPERGVEILQPMRHLGDSVAYVHEHHERFDGSGYPEGKVGSQISLGGQIVGIAEAWVALLEDRAYRKGTTREEANRLIEELSGRWFSREVTEALRASDVGMI